MARVCVGLVQMRVDADPDTNMARALEKMGEAADLGCAIICLPELYRSQYFCQYEDPSLFDLAEPVPGPSTVRFAQFARARRITVLAPLFEKRAPGLYHNSVGIIGPDGEIVGLYRKMHIPDDPGYYEKFYFTPGDLGFQTFQVDGARVGTLICWDQWYPEAARLTALRGAEVLFYPTAIGWHPVEKMEFGEEQREAWRTIQRSHAIANGVYVAAVNRVGLEQPSPEQPGIEFWGSSFICDPFGKIVAEASEAEEEIIVATVDSARIEEVRRNWPFLRDRRIDAYADIGQRFLDRP